MTTISYFHSAKESGEKIPMVTAYDFTSAKLASLAGFKTLLVGDSLGMVIQGSADTLSVTLDDIIYHTRFVVKGAKEAFVIGDMPYMSYQASVEDALRSAGAIVKSAKCQAVKLEGGDEITPQISALVKIGIPVMGHIGMQPQSFNQYGGYGKRGKSGADQDYLKSSALRLQEAGAFSLVLENIPHDLAREITASLKIPTIGIGAGVHCDGQIQVFHDILGLTPDFMPRHTKRYAESGQIMIDALKIYIDDVNLNKFISK